MGPACSGVERVDELNVSLGNAFKDKLRDAISDVDCERRLTLIDEIKRAQDSDPALVKLKDMVTAGQEAKFEIHHGVLKLNGRLCVPNVDGLRQRIL